MSTQTLGGLGHQLNNFFQFLKLHFGSQEGLRSGPLAPERNSFNLASIISGRGQSQGWRTGLSAGGAGTGPGPAGRYRRASTSHCGDRGGTSSSRPSPDLGAWTVHLRGSHVHPGHTSSPVLPAGLRLRLLGHVRKPSPASTHGRRGSVSQGSLRRMRNPRSRANALPGSSSAHPVLTAWAEFLECGRQQCPASMVGVGRAGGRSRSTCSPPSSHPPSSLYRSRPGQTAHLLSRPQDAKGKE